MRKSIFFVAIFVFAIVQSQVRFEKGYIINHQNEKSEVLIKNLGWLNNPVFIEYKTSENEKIQNADVSRIKEFGVYNTSSYVVSEVDLDKSPEGPLNVLSADPKPNFVKETLFLQKIVDGKAKLFRYQAGNLVRFFYQTHDSEITPLVYNTYQVLNSEGIGRNMEFRKQLENNMKCGENWKTARRINYNQNSITQFFADYNSCVEGSSGIVAKKKKKLLGITIRPGVRYSKASLTHDLDEQRNAEFEGKFGFRGGLELEFFLPFAQNRFSVVAEPTYFNYSSSINRTRQYPYSLPVEETLSVKASGIDVPIGFRYNVYLDDSRVMLDAGMVLTSIFKSSSELTVSYQNPKTLQSARSFFFGAGYSFGNKYSAQLRLFTRRNLSDETHGYTNLNYSAMELVFGYKIF